MLGGQCGWVCTHVHTHIWTCICHSIHVRVKGQSTGISSRPCGSWGWSSGGLPLEMGWQRKKIQHAEKVSFSHWGQEVTAQLGCHESSYPSY